MLLNRAARRYARAVTDAASASQCGERVVSDLRRILELTEASPDLAGFLGNYALPAGSRARVLAALFRPGVHAMTWRLIRVMEEKRRLALLPDACRAAIEESDRRAGVVVGLLRSPFALSEADQARLSSWLGGRTGRTVRVHAAVQPSLIGGFRFLVEDSLYDYSVAGALERCRRRMAGGGGGA